MLPSITKFSYCAVHQVYYGVIVDYRANDLGYGRLSDSSILLVSLNTHII